MSHHLPFLEPEGDLGALWDRLLPTELGQHPLGPFEVRERKGSCDLGGDQVKAFRAQLPGFARLLGRAAHRVIGARLDQVEDDPLPIQTGGPHLHTVTD